MKFYINNIIEKNYMIADCFNMTKFSPIYYFLIQKIRIGTFIDRGNITEIDY